jgi:hypothetical protein
MSTVQWEYATLTWANAMKKITTKDPEYERLSEKIKADWEAGKWPFYWWIDQTYYVWLPGATEADKRHGWSTGDDAFTTNGLDVLNELGAEGWEVVTQTVRASAVGENHGRTNASFPIETSTLLKRRVA